MPQAHYQIYSRHSTTGEVYSEITCTSWEQVIEFVDCGAYTFELADDVVCVVAINGLTDGTFKAVRISREQITEYLAESNTDLKSQRQHIRTESRPALFANVGGR